MRDNLNASYSEPEKPRKLDELTPEELQSFLWSIHDDAKEIYSKINRAMEPIIKNGINTPIAEHHQWTELLSNSNDSLLLIQESIEELIEKYTGKKHQGD